MSQLSRTGNVAVGSTRKFGGLIASWLLVAAIIGAAIVLRQAAGAPTAPALKTTTIQAPARDDFAFRQPTTATVTDDYGLRHNAAALAVVTTSRTDDYAVRHPSNAAAASGSQRSTDFGLRHASWSMSAGTITPSRDDYGLR